MSDSPQAIAYKFLKAHDLGVISTTRVDGSPIGAAIYYVVDEDFNIFFVTKTNTIKFSNLKMNSVTALTVIDESERTTIQAEGVAEEIKSDDAEPKIMNMLAKVRSDKKHVWFPPVALLEDGEYTLVKIRLNKVKLADYKNYKPGEELIHNINV